MSHYPFAVSIIVAVADNGVIGRNNQLPWHLPADLRYFKHTTWGMPLIMGRKTFESIGKPLPGRDNIVLSRDAGFSQPGVFTAGSLEQGFSIADKSLTKEVFIIGGARIFEQVMPLADRIYCTRVHFSPDGDIFFPTDFGPEWKRIKETRFDADEKNDYAYAFEVWEREGYQ